MVEYWYLYLAERRMKELVRTNDTVLLSWLQALLTDAGIGSNIFDMHTSILEGSAGAISRRLVVAELDFRTAKNVLIEAGEGKHLGR